MRSFELVRPKTIAAAAEHAASGALIKAAGIDVLDRLKERLDEPSTLVNLSDLRTQFGGPPSPGADGGVVIGALTTLAEIAGSQLLAEPAYAAIQQAAAKTATPQVRNRATAAGNLLQLTRCWYRRSSQIGCAHGGDGPDCVAQNGENRYHAIMGTIDCFRVHPSNLAPALIALDASVRIRGVDGTQRVLPIHKLYPEEAYADEAEHTLEAGEIVLAIEVPEQPPGSRSSYRDSREKHSFDWPTTSAAVRMTTDDDGTAKDVRICLGAVSPTPVHAPTAAATLAGNKVSETAFRTTAAKAFESAEPLEQNAYKVELGQNILCQALADAAGLSEEGSK